MGYQPRCVGPNLRRTRYDGANRLAHSVVVIVFTPPVISESSAMSVPTIAVYDVTRRLLASIMTSGKAVYWMGAADSDQEKRP